jgi:aspartyl-tRNA(Asn)/glutamyl-tRNA(Gln) amidotransferase subunit A
MARTVEDCALLLQAIAGYDARDSGSIEQAVPDYRAALGDSIKGLRIGVLRHYWEEDLPGPEDQRSAMEEAIAVFKSLGAIVEDARARPMMDGMDIKVIIAETELFAIHHKDLVSRPADFGRDFLGRVLPACMFQSFDYVEALREHRRYIAEMKPLFEKHDVLLTCGFGPAPRLDAHSTANFWKRSNVFTPSNVGRTPALVMCGGFSKTGLPLGVQLLGRPRDDARVLQAGHAFQRATDWHQRRPKLERGKPQPVLQPANEAVRPALDAATQAFIEHMARRAGLSLDERLTTILLETAPYALAMAERIRKPRSRMDEPSLVFRFG